MKSARGVVAAGVWVAGIILAHGFWSTFFAVILPLWAVYIVVEKILMSLGWVS